MIDGHQIIRGFDKPVIDPAGTKAAISGLLEQTSEYQALETAKTEAVSALNAAKDQVNTKRLQLINTYMGAELEEVLKGTDEYISYKAIEAEHPTDSAADIKARADAWKLVQEKKAELQKLCGNVVNDRLLETDEWKNYVSVKSEQDNNVRTAQKALQNKNVSLIEANAVHFTPKEGEIAMEAEEIDALQAQFNALPENALLNLEGEQISDFRGKVYWETDIDVNWQHATIENIGVDLPAGALWDSELTYEQRLEIMTQLEELRIDGLTDEDRRTEFKAKADAIAAEGGTQKQALRITGLENGEAWEIANTWYDAEMRKLWDKYGYTRLGRQYCIDWAGEEIWTMYGIKDV